MTIIDLTFAKTTVEGLMTDTCRITRNLEGTRDAVLDETTGRLIEAPPTTVYEGQCKMRPEFTPVPRLEVGQEVTTSRYVLSIPLPTDPAQEPKNGDNVEMLTSMRDPGLVGQHFHVGEGVEYKTFAIQRKVHCTVKQRVGDRP